MKYQYVAFSVIFLAGITVAGGIELSKNAISVSPPDPQGQVVINGLPGCVVGLPPIYIMARNKNTGMAVNASALFDGSFSLHIPASGSDTVKLTFISADGKKKGISMKVPEAGQELRGEAGAPQQRGSTVNVDLGEFSRFGAPEVVHVKTDGKSGTIVHVGDRPPQQPPAPAPVTTSVPSPTPSPEPIETPSAIPGTEEAAAPPTPEQTPTDNK
jgi:hypothetical protein